MADLGFAFEGEPVDLAMLEAGHARHPMPPAGGKSDKASWVAGQRW